MVKKFSKQNFKKRQNKFMKDSNNSNLDIINNYNSDDDVDYEQNDNLMKEITNGYIILDKVLFIEICPKYLIFN